MTAEAALVLPVLVALTIALSWLLTLGIAQVRAVDSARETARALARDEDQAAALALGQRVAPPGSTLRVARDGDSVVVDVDVTVAGIGGLLEGLPDVHLTARAVAAMEDVDAGEGS